MVQNKGLIFKKTPSHWPIPGEHLAIETREFDLDAAPPKDGITVKNFYISFDPYQRGGLRDPDAESYFPPYTIGEAITNGGLSTVVKSNSPNYKEGDVVLGTFGTEEYSAVPAQAMFMVRKFENPYHLDPILFVGPLGVAGLSAYSSFYEIGKPQKGQTMFVSAASGAVGQLVGQLAKIEGLTVIGSVGSDEKLAFIKELGYDDGFNYKKEKPAEALARLAPNGLDIYFDNVGGQMFDAALVAMKDYGRISTVPTTEGEGSYKLTKTVGCGMISQYNLPPEERYGVKNMMNLFLKRLHMQGFIVSDLPNIIKYVGPLQVNMSKWIHEGKIKTKQHVTEGIDNAVTGFLEMFKGDNFGKAVLKITDID